MNRTRPQTKAAKARKDWEILQDQKRKEKKIIGVPKLKKVRTTRKEISLRETA